MRLEFECWQCAEGTPGRRVAAPFNEAGTYTFRCAHGHVHNIVLVQSRFEILAETAMQAIVDGYYREAVASFAAAAERFWQFYIDVVGHSRNIEASIRQSSWKLVSNQSERQLGMFFGVYQLENGEVPPLLDQKHVAFRNRVIHQGYLPSEEEAVEFGQAVVGLLQPIINTMMPRYKANIDALTIVHTDEASAKFTRVGRKHLVFYDFILRFDTEADDWNPAAANIRMELAARRARQGCPGNGVASWRPPLG